VPLVGVPPKSGKISYKLLILCNNSHGLAGRLTTGIGILPGLIGSKGTTDTSGNDLIIAQNIGAPATWTMNPADQIDAGAGVNTFKLFANGDADPASVAQGQFPILTNVQNLWIDHFGSNTLDVTTSQFPNLSAVQLNNVNGGGVFADTANLIVSHDAVTFSNDSTGGNSYVLSSAADTSENVTFSAVGVTGNHSFLNAAFDIGAPAHSANVTALTIQSTGGANFVDFGSDIANPLSSITFAHNAGTGDTAFTGNNVHFNPFGGAPGSTSAETIDASAFTASLTLGTTGAAFAVATGFGDSGSGFGDTVKLGSGTTYFAENAVADGQTGDTITLLAGHTKVDTLDSTASTVPTYTTVANETLAMSIVTNFNLVGTTFASGDILKMAVGAEQIGTAADINGNLAADVWHDVAGHAGFVAGGSVTQFLTDVWSGAAPVAGDTIAYTDGHNTYVAYFDAGPTGNAVIVELVGVHTAIGLHQGATATGQINIA
jgi:hypothetical protein